MNLENSYKFVHLFAEAEVLAERKINSENFLYKPQRPIKKKYKEGYEWYTTRWDNPSDEILVTSLSRLDMPIDKLWGPAKIEIENHLFCYQHDLISKDEYYPAKLMGVYKSDNRTLYLHYC